MSAEMNRPIKFSDILAQDLGFQNAEQMIKFQDDLRLQLNYVSTSEGVIANRVPILVRGKQAFVDFLSKTLSIDLTLEKVHSASHVYLLSTDFFQEEGDEKNILTEDAKMEILTKELLSWIHDESFWPMNVSSGHFPIWFSVEYLAAAIDISHHETNV